MKIPESKKENKGKYKLLDIMMFSLGFLFILGGTCLLIAYLLFL